MKTVIATFHLKGGQSFDVSCDEIEIKDRDNALVSYEIKGLREGKTRPLYVRIADVSAITTKTV